MELDSIQDSTRYVVSDVHHGSILPGNRAEMNRNVFLLSHADIKGGVWANELTLNGADITIAQSVYSRGSITIEDTGQNQSQSQHITPDRNPVTFGSCVVASDSILIKARQFRVRFKSDVYTKKINLSHSIVFGNVFAESAIIKNSIVLGGVFCKNQLEMENSMVSTFRTRSVGLGGNLFLFFPFAVSETPIHIQEPIKALTFFNIYKSINTKATADSEEPGDGVILFDQDDVFEVFYEDSNTAPDVKNGESGKKAYILSGNERIVDTEKIAQHFQYNHKFLENLTLGNHFDPTLKVKQFDRPIEELEYFLWNILHSDQTFNTVSGTSKIHDMFKRSDVKEILGEIFD